MNSDRAPALRAASSRRIRLAAFAIVLGLSNASPALLQNVAHAASPVTASCTDAQGIECRAGSRANGPRVDVSMTATADSTAPGQSIVYTLTARNVGNADAAGTIVRDPMPFGLSRFDWTCSGTAPCPNSRGEGSLHEELAHFPPGSALTYVITARVAGAPPSRITHTATVNPPYTGDCQEGSVSHVPPCVARVVNRVTLPCGDASAPACTDTVAGGLIVAASPSLSVSQSTVGYSTSSQTFSYLVDITNPATSGAAANPTRVEIPVPIGITSFDSWSCALNGTPCTAASGSGAIDQVLDTLQPGDTYAFTIQVTKDISLPQTITSDVTVTPPAPFVCEVGGSAPPCTTQLSLNTSAAATLALTINKESGSASAGEQVGYTLSLENQTPGAAANGTVVSFPMPTGIESMTWECQSNGAECPALSGSGAVNETVAVLHEGTGLSYIITATLGASPPTFVEAVATATPPAGSTVTCAATGASAPCQVTDNLPTVPLIEVQNAFSENSAMPGAPIHYGLRVSNFGTSIGSAMHVSDPSPSGLEGITWTCEGSASYICPNGSSGAGALEQDITSFAVNDFAQYAVNATVSASAPAQITRTATITPAAPAVCGSPDPSTWPTIAPAVSAPPCVGAASVYSSSLLFITQTANVSQLVPGGSVVYTITLHNEGLPSNGAHLVVPMPTGIDQTSWTCSSVGDVMCSALSGSGNLDEALGFFPPSGSLVYTLTGHVSDNATGSVTHTATLVPETGGACSGSCSSASILPLAVVPTANLKISKSVDSPTAMPGDTIMYTVTLRNLGSAAAINTVLADPLPAGITSFNWTCTSTTAECPSQSGSGAIAQTIPTLTGQVQYTVSAIVDSTAANLILNTATVTPANGATCDQSLCSASAATSIEPPVAQVVVSTVSSVPNGAQAPAGQPVRWTINVTNNGTPTSGTLTITDQLPAAIEQIVVRADPAVRCTPTQPTGGQSLVCTIAAGFTGSAQIVIDAVVSIDASGTLSNNVSASGNDQPACNTCSTNAPIAVATDVALGNARPFSAGGINGSLFDVVNLRGAVPLTLSASPASAVQVFGSYTNACTASSDGDGDGVVVSCPPAPPTLQMNCTGATCSIGSLAAGATLTVFIAAKDASSAITVQANVAGDITPDNNTLQIAGAGAP